MAAVIAIAVAVSGCSKGEDGVEEKNNMELDGQKIKKMIDEHLAGTWQCECGYVESEHFKTCACCGRRRAEPVQLKKVV